MRTRIKYFLVIMLLVLYSLCSAQSITSDNPRKLFHINNGWSGSPDTITATDADADAFISAAGITNTTQKNAITRFVLDLKGVRNDAYATANIWSKFSAIWPFVGGTSTTCKYNLKDPRDADDAYRLTFTGGSFSDSGWTVNLDGVANTHIIFTDFFASDATQLSASIYMQWYWTGFGTRGLIGCRDATQLWQIGLQSNNINYGCNVSTGFTINNTVNGGFFLYSKNPTDHQAYVAGVKAMSASFSGTTFLIANSLYLMAINSGTPPTSAYTGLCQFASFGKVGLSQYEATCFSNAVNQFQRAINRTKF